MFILPLFSCFSVFTCFMWGINTPHFSTKYYKNNECLDKYINHNQQGAWLLFISSVLNLCWIISSLNLK